MLDFFYKPASGRITPPASRVPRLAGDLPMFKEARIFICSIIERIVA